MVQKLNACCLNVGFEKFIKLVLLEKLYGWTKCYTHIWSTTYTSKDKN